ncbi:FMRFamide-related peptides-like [Melitaea cinxia]|uniref:FMRFamide-related peptides-like n=1 Tax=Melitaea cinxia TaxID=113334 RepID=UPI001E272067|nr:FMRFamide-related peptides-like [Melitaea cinxia]
MINNRIIMLVVVICLAAGVMANPVRRSPDLEARRRSAIDRSMIRFGRSYPPEPSAGEVREAFQRPTRRGNSFLRFGRTQPLSFTTDDLISLLRTYEDEYDSPASKRVSNFVRLGRDPKFIRLGRSTDEDKPEYEQGSELVVSGYPQRKSRARDHFIRLGRDSEELTRDTDLEEPERKKRSTDCHDCQS